jgi:hypothetical protein
MNFREMGCESRKWVELLLARYGTRGAEPLVVLLDSPFIIITKKQYY